MRSRYLLTRQNSSCDTVTLVMTFPSETPPTKQLRSFDPPQEPEWHRMIAEAAYYLAERRGFLGDHSMNDWLTAEKQVRQVISPILDSEATMDDTTS